jgi:hypothetical protein
MTTSVPAMLRSDEPAVASVPAAPTFTPPTTGIEHTEVVVDGLPGYGLVRSLRALLPTTGAVRRFKTAHLELVLDGDHADAIYDALQGHVLSADGHAVQLVIDESEPGRVALHAVSLDDAGVTDGTANAAEAQRVPLFDEPGADAGVAVDAGPGSGAVDAGPTTTATTTTATTTATPSPTDAGTPVVDAGSG